MSKTEKLLWALLVITLAVACYLAYLIDAAKLPS